MKITPLLTLIALSSQAYSKDVSLVINNKLKKNSSIEISKLKFGDDKSNGESIAKIISTINVHNNDFVNPGKKKKLSSKIYFKPEFDSKEGKIFVQGDSASVRLYQTLFYKNSEKKTIYVPFIGAEINLFVSGLKNENGTFKSGHVSSINSSLIDSSAYEHYIQKFKNYGPHSFSYTTKENRESMVKELSTVELESLVNAIYPESGIKDRETFSRQATSDTKLIEKFLNHNRDNTEMVFVKNKISDTYDLAYRVTNPYNSGRIIDLNIEHMNSKLILGNNSISKHVKVNIYTGNILKLQKRLKASGESEVWENKKVKDSFFKQEDYETSLINLSKVVEYFKKTFSWNGFDNKGSDLNATVKYKGSKLFGTRELKQNAAWIGAPYNQFLFGDGGKELNNFIDALDVIGHEYFHAVIGHTSNLDNGGEQGALNEHLADILGVGFESIAEGREYDFKIGEKVVVKSDVALRDFLDPKRSMSEQPQHMDEVNQRFGPYCVPSERNDSCGVHYSNGVLNKAIGLSIKDLGWDRLKDVVFEVATKRLRSSSDFLDYRNQTLLSCEENKRLSQEDCQKIEGHFETVGISDSIIVSSNNPVNVEICSSIKSTCEMLKSYGSNIDTCVQCGF